LERGPAGVGGGIAAETDERIGNFGGADGAVERLGIDFVSAIHGESSDLVSAIELNRARGLTTPST
jgi:hypothetical protein